MEKTDFEALLKQPVKPHLSYFAEGPMDLTKQRTEVEPPKTIEIGVANPTVTVVADGQRAPVSASPLIRIRYVELGYVETANSIVHFYLYHGHTS